MPASACIFYAPLPVPLGPLHPEPHTGGHTGPRLATPPAAGRATKATYLDETCRPVGLFCSQTAQAGDGQVNNSLPGHLQIGQQPVTTSRRPAHRCFTSARYGYGATRCRAQLIPSSLASPETARPGTNRYCVRILVRSTPYPVRTMEGIVRRQPQPQT